MRIYFNVIFNYNYKFILLIILKILLQNSTLTLLLYVKNYMKFTI